MNFVEIEAAIGGACYDEVAIVDWVEEPPKSAIRRDDAWRQCGALGRWSIRLRDCN